ncbi:MAG: hypothetical protein AAFN09_04975 [Pseudomonadota bacterium]
MEQVRSYTARFYADDHGAVSVDWVVLSAALVGLGIAVLGVTSTGVNDLANETADEIASTELRYRFGFTSALFDSDFGSGAAGWFGGNVVNLPGFGDVLQIAGGQFAEMQVMVPAGAGSATISFDMIAADDLDGDQATVYVNGQAVSIYSDNHGNVSISGNAPPGISVSVDQHYENRAVGAGTHGSDSRATYTITVDDPGSSLTFGVGSNANDGIGDEFYAIDDVSISAS